jgi:cytochrome c-type biogenesis protein CcmH
VFERALLKTLAWLALAMAGLGASAQSAAPPVAAVERQAASMAADPALEARVMAIAEELRCLVCQNETIAASNAGLAVDLRKQIRLQLGEGQSRQQILDFMVARYGDFVLYRPPLQASTVLLWVGPFALLAAAAAMLARAIARRRGGTPPPALNAQQLQRARQLLGEADASGAGRT